MATKNNLEFCAAPQCLYIVHPPSLYCIQHADLEKKGLNGQKEKAHNLTMEIDGKPTEVYFD